MTKCSSAKLFEYLILSSGPLGRYISRSEELGSVPVRLLGLHHEKV